MTTSTDILDTREIDNQTLDAATRAKSLVIRTEEDYIDADTLATVLRGIEKQIDDTFDHLIEQAFRHHRSLVAEKKKHYEPIDAARRVIKQKMMAWKDEQDRIRREQEARLRAEEQKRAEDAQIKAAQEAERNGDKKMAEAIIAAPVQAAPVVLKNDTPKATTTFQKRWKFRIVDVNLVPREYLSVDEQKVGGVIRATKGSVQIPGIEAYSETV